jgi:mRNA degradation ribonuclease J1/J2
VRVKDGRLVRAFAATDEGIVWNKGRATKEERGLGLKLFELRGVRERKGDAGGELILHPTEDHVMRLASRWSIDPTTLYEAHAEPALGYVALAPSSWRAERLRRAA